MSSGASWNRTSDLSIISARQRYRGERLGTAWYSIQTTGTATNGSEPPGTRDGRAMEVSHRPGHEVSSGCITHLGTGVDSAHWGWSKHLILRFIGRLGVMRPERPVNGVGRRRQSASGWVVLVRRA